MENKEIYTYKGKAATVEFTFDYSMLEWADGSNVDYQDAVEKLHPEIKWFHGIGGSYQGEWWSAGVDASGQWWGKQGSFGSCSYCDWLQGIETKDAAEEFFADMERIDPIGKSAEEAIAYLLKSKENTYSDAEEAIDDVIRGIRDAFP